MKKWAVFLLMVALPAAAQYSESCRCKTDDPYDFGPQMPSGRYAGRCQNNCVSRTLLPLTNVDADSVELANVRYNDRFYTTTIPMRSVSRVFVQTVYTPGIVGLMSGHTQTRYSFSEPIVLRPQAGWDDGHGDVMLHDLMISAEANGPAGVGFDIFIKGMQGAYTLVYRAMGLDPLKDDPNRIGRDSFIPGKPGSPGGRIRQMELDLGPAERTTLLRQALRYAHEAGSFQIYHSLRKNCSTEFFYPTLDVAFPPTKKLWNHLAAMHPVFNHDALKERHFLKRTAADLKQEHECRQAGGTPDTCLDRHR